MRSRIEMKERPPATALTEDFHRMIREAEGFLRSSSFEQQELGKEILREVMRLAEGSIHARRAEEILMAAEPGAVEPDDPELDKLKVGKSSLQGFDDPRLSDFLKRLEAYPRAVRLRSEVSDVLRSWISVKLSQLENHADNNQIANLNALVASVQGVAIYEELREFTQLRNTLSELETLRRTLDDLLSQVATDPPADWSETRRQAGLFGQLENYLNHSRVPTNWESQLRVERDRLSGFVQQFVRAQASTSVTVHNANELRELADKLISETEGFPPGVTAGLSNLVEGISKNAAEWKAMQDGQHFELPSATDGPLSAPPAWHSDAPRYKTWLQQIESALNVIRSETGKDSEPDCHESLMLADGILEQAPGHTLATNLKLESTRRIICYQLDRALQSWNPDSFFDLLETSSPGDSYAGLQASKHVLFELKALTGQPPFADWQAARNWWTVWQTNSKALPSARPAALSEALSQETNKRYQQWDSVLNRLLHENVAPQEYQQAARSLDDERDTRLKEYRRKLLRLATIGQIEEQIRDEQLAEAEQGLRELSPKSKDAKRLRTRLKVRQARLNGSMAAAEYLSSDWENIRIYAEHPAQILLGTLRGVWSENHQELVTKLTSLLTRAIRVVKDTTTAQELRDWRTWLEIEVGLLHECSSTYVKRLVEYLRSAEPGELLDQRLDKLLRHWQSNKNTVMLAWAYQVFRHKSAVADIFEGAADELNEESDKVADDVQFTLARRGALELIDLLPLLELLQNEEKRRRSLQDFLTLYSQHTVEQWRPSSKFIQAKTTLNELLHVLTVINHLEKTDMRQATSRRDFDEAFSSAYRLKRIASRQRLLDTLERLRPLTSELSSIENGN